MEEKRENKIQNSENRRKAKRITNTNRKMLVKKHYGDSGKRRRRKKSEKIYSIEYISYMLRERKMNGENE